MKSKVFIVFLLALFLTTGILLGGCAKREPPGKEEIYERFQDAHSDIQIVLNYLVQTEYDTIFYPTPDGEVFADFERIPIDDTIKDAVHSLIREHNFIRFGKRIDDNAIAFEMWTDQLECECGVVYALNKEILPTVEYLTLLEPLPEDGWYYYVEDYNEWRRNNS